MVWLGKILVSDTVVNKTSKL